MKIRQRVAQPARAPVPTTKGAPSVETFTARELDAAEQLIHLSESSASSGTLRAHAGSGGSFSSRSVDTPPAPPAAPAGAVLLGGCVDWEEDEEHEVAGRQRRVKRYRLIKEIYAATEGIGRRTGPKNKKE